MKSKIFSYQVEGILLEPVNDNLNISKPFDRKVVIEQLKELLNTESFKVDERTLNYKIRDNQLYIEGLAVENEEPKSIGFMSGK
jgi:hypothetical protein